MKNFLKLPRSFVCSSKKLKSIVSALTRSSKTDKVDILYRLDATTPIVILRCDVVKIVSTGGTRNRVSLQFQKISEKNKRDIVMFLQEKQIEKARRKKGD